jgi:hypothetical protein
MSEVCATIRSICITSSDSLFRNHCIPSLAPFANSVSSIGTLLPIGGIFRNFGPAHTVFGGTLSNGYSGSVLFDDTGARAPERARAGVKMQIHSRRLVNRLQYADSNMAMERLVDKSAFVDTQAFFSSSRLNQFCAVPVAANEV